MAAKSSMRAARERGIDADPEIGLLVRGREGGEARAHPVPVSPPDGIGSPARHRSFAELEADEAEGAGLRAETAGDALVAIDRELPIGRPSWRGSPRSRRRCRSRSGRSPPRARRASARWATERPSARRGSRGPRRASRGRPRARRASSPPGPRRSPRAGC